MIFEIVRNCPRGVTDAGLMRLARVLQAVGLGGCLLVAVACGAPDWLQEQADRIVGNVADAFAVTRERAIAGLISDEDLDKMSMSFEESLAHSAAESDPHAPPFVRGPELIARRAQLDAKLKDIRERRAQGLPDEPAGVRSRASTWR